MGMFVQKVAMDFGEKYIRLYLYDTKEYTEELQSKVFLEFQAAQFRFSKKNKKPRSFSSLFCNGTIEDVDLLCAYIRFLFSRAGLGKFAFARIDLILTVPTSTIQTTKQVWTTALEDIGISKITFVSQSIAGAIGAGYTFPIPTVAVIAHLGHSSSEVAAVSLHECLFSTKLEFTGRRLFDTVRTRYFAQTRQELSAREWALLESTIGVTLLRTIEGKPSIGEKKKKAEAVSLEVILEFAADLFDDIQVALEKLSVEELSLCSAQGIVLTGELAKQEGIAQFLSRKLSIPVYGANDPEMAVVRGASGLLTFMDQDEAR